MINILKLYSVIITISSISFCVSMNSDEQVVIKIDGVSRNDSIFDKNGSVPIGDASRAVVTKWAPWSECQSCQQHRTKQRLHANATWVTAEEVEERPCRRSVCLRLWHKRRSRRRMRIVKINLTKSGGVKYYDNPHRRKTRMWSKWSTWSKCSKTCHTQRYKVCKKPGRCSKLKKYESALCYHPNSLCEQTVHLQLQLYNLPRRTNPEITARTTSPPSQPRRDSARAPRYKQQCGRPLRKLSLMKIKGGRDAGRGQWPWHVAVVNQHDETFCSGTLIAPRWVLTAAHCIRSKLKVRLNEFDLWQSDGEIEIPIERAVRHGGFNVTNIDNDIGLLYMARAVKTPVACLPNGQSDEYETAEKCTVLGWGARDASRDNGYHILQEARLPIVHRDKCRAAYSDYRITTNMFCAGYSTGKIDTCSGDSGGGLLCQSWQTQDHASRRKRKPSGYVIQGITSFGDACGKPHRYGIYTNVTNYIDWIRYTMAEVARERRNYQRSYNNPYRSVAHNSVFDAYLK